MVSAISLFGIATGLFADDGPADPQASAPWQINADRIDYDQNQDAYTAQGDVSITRQGQTLTAERVHLNQKTGEASADGNVRLVSASDVLSGDHLDLNLNTETGVVTDGTVFISKSHLYLSGREIRKTGPQSYSAERISITACDGPDPAWQLTGRDFKVTIEGYGSAKHTALWAGKVPVLYSPYLFFPVKLKRQSGLLMPEFGYSDRKGSEYRQPLFWAINDSSDATLYIDFMSQRGLRAGIEYRYILNEESMGAVLVDGFQDAKIDDGRNDNTKLWGYGDDTTLRENKDRYWFRMKHDQRLGGGMTAKLDLDVVSDQDYLHEFKSGQNGFNATRKYFLETFGRDIDDYNDPIRLNQFNLNRTWNQYSFNTDVKWYDDVIRRRQATENNTLQQLPSISLEGIKQTLGRTPLYFDLDSSYTHFYRIDGTRGQRADIYPRLYYPLDIFQALSVEPSVGMRGTAWHIDNYETPPDHGRYSLYRALYDFKLDVSTEFYRIFDFGMGGSDLLKHAITPEIIYEFIPEEDQSEYPVFDAIDRIERKNLITYGFTNTFTARASSQARNLERQYAYTQFLRFKLAQSFDINKHNDDDPEPFSDITAELDLTPGQYVGLDTDAQWSVYDHRFEAFNTALRLWDKRGDLLTTDYRYTRETSATAMDGIQTVRLDGELRLSDRWRLRGGYELNMYDKKEIERAMGISYQSRCWGVMVDCSYQQGNRSIGIMFNLAGLANIGM
jgi:LPS-assembly protein